MQKSLIFLLFISLISFSCSNDSVVSPPGNNTKGNISMSVDKSSCPPDVVLIVATLSREGYNDIADSLDLLSDSTAEISMTGIPSGEWFLNVEAFNSSNVIIYSGQTEVSVFEDNITNVSLVLNPVYTGTGSIKISVTWGTSQTPPWGDYSLNPILSYTGDTYDYHGIMQPKILYDNGKYKMWYVGLANSSRSVVCYAESYDGLSWTRPVQNPVMSYGDPGAWDATAAIAGAVIKEDSIYKMYYVGWNDQYSNWNIGLATSYDGIHWTKYPNPIIYGTTGWEYQIIPSAVLKKDGVYYLYYSGLNNHNAKVGLALSYDGINFTRYSGNPVLWPDENWEGTGVNHASVIKDGSVFRMVYGCVPANAFGSAVSSDGKNWVKNNSNPVFTTENTYNYWANDIAYPCYIKTENQYRIYYSGYNGRNVYPYYRIGVTIKN